ncbi:MAG: hypothetical protein AAGF55_05485 [Pseudomonadota bacterium]
MHTEWGLDLDMSAVRLMRRSGENWDEVQTEAIDSPDIEERLNAMLSKIDSGAEVTLFLPLDQILCTDVEIAGDAETKAEIGRAMDGRTPYALDELVLDWEIVAPGQAKVAAIAQDTLDEAAAFAEVRGIGVSTYSSLGLGDAFPRLPRFAGPHVPSGTAVEPVEAPAAPEPQDAAMFATARKPSRPPLDANSSTGETLILKPEPGASIEVSDAPVVQVDDATPVMLVKSPKLDLKADAPATGRIARPRVRTDIAAGTVSGNAASLSPAIRPGGSVQVHRRRSPLATTALVFAAAFVLTIGIATLVWSLLPLSPDRSTAPAQADTGLIDPVEAPEVEVAAPEIELDTPSGDTSTIPELAEVDDPVAPEVPDLPQPVIFAEIEATAAPTASALQPLEVNQDVAPQSRLATLASLSLSAKKPDYDATPPLAIVPEAFASILKVSPGIAAAPKATETLVDVVIASVESSKFAPDAIALPSIFGLQADDLPQTTEAPAAPVILVEDAPQVASLSPSAPPTLADESAGDLALTPDTPIEEPPALAALGPAPAQELPEFSLDVAVAALERPVEETPEVATNSPGTEDLNQDYNVDDALAAAVAEALADALAGPGGLIPTEHAAALPDTGPRRRPQTVVETIEREQFGGRTRTELAILRPPPRPASEQSAEPAAPPSALAVASSRAPRLRPDNFGNLVTAARVRREAEQLSASVNTRTPDTSSAVQAALATEPQQPVRTARQPNIPTSASVARQATIDNAIRLNRVNLVGVYGAASDRRALVRLPSGRYVKVKVGDRVDGGTVAQITDRELIYRKGSRTLSLAIPQS